MGRRQRYKGGAGNTSTVRSSALIGVSLLLFIFTLIIPILASFNYKFPVKIMLGCYMAFLFAYGFTLDWYQTPSDPNGNPQMNETGDVVSNSALNTLTNKGLLGFLLPFTFLYLCLTYKNYTIFFPVTFALIGAIVLINSFENNIYINVLSFLFATAAEGTLIALAVQQSYVRTKGGTDVTVDDEGNGKNQKSN
jgi:hypothetical protein